MAAHSAHAGSDSSGSDVEVHSDIEDYEASVVTVRCWPRIDSWRTDLAFEDHATSAARNSRSMAAADYTASGAAAPAMVENARLVCTAAAEHKLCMAVAGGRCVFVSEGSIAGRSQAVATVGLVDGSTVDMVMPLEAQLSSILLPPFSVC